MAKQKDAFTWKWTAMHPTDVDPITRDRRVIHGEMQAASAEIVRGVIEAERSLIVVDIAQKSQFGGTEWSIAKLTGIPSGKAMAEAYRQLAQLVKASVPLPEAVAAVADGSSELMIRETFGDLRDKVTQGYPLHKAMADHPKVFDEMTIQLLRAAVEGGFADRTLLNIADMAENKNKIKKKIRSALMMPAITVLAAIGVGILMSVVMIPQLAAMLQDMNPDEPLPLNTQIMMWFADNIIWIGPVVLALSVGWYFYNRKVLRYNEGWQRFKSKVALKTPVFGKLTRLQAVATLSRGLEMMISAGVRQTEALNILAPTMINRLYRDATEELAVAVVEGRSLSEVMIQYPNLYDFAFVKMIQVGENSGGVDEMLAVVATQKEQDVDDMTDNLAALLNPLALMVVGFIIGFLALSMFGPILAIAGSL